MTEVVLFIYLSGVIASMIVWSIRQFKGEGSIFVELDIRI